MPRIILGAGSAQLLLDVPMIPNVGDEIATVPERVLGYTSNGCLMVGDTFLLISDKVEMINEEEIHRFGVKNTKPI